MTDFLVLDSLLTEYDESISAELNIDPLGLLVIWSSYGQNIFQRRISSISNDVRNYTLNLFNHAVIRALVEDDSVELGRGLRSNPAYASGGKDSLAFKQACLIYLENVFTYSMIEAQNRPNVETVGVLGVSIARRRWGETKGHPRLLFSHQSDAHVLKRQNSLGVSGRYKTPLVEMSFFDSTYDYALPESGAQWQLVQAQLLAKSKPLHGLYKLACEHLKGVIADSRKVPACDFSDLPDELRRCYVAAFRSPPAVGEYAREFWFSVTKLNEGAAGALYEVLNDEWSPTGQYQMRPSADVFAQAASKPTLKEGEKAMLEQVRLLEPFLAELDLLLGVMLSVKSQRIGDAVAKWKSLGRDSSTLPDLAQPIEANTIMRAQVAERAAGRLSELLALARRTTVQHQMEGLLRYHDKVMQARGQSSWLRLLGGQQLKVDVRVRQLPAKDDRPLGAWVHQYYLPQFRNLLSGFRGDV